MAKKTIYETELAHGKLVFKLLDVLDKKNISYNKFMNDTATKYDTIMRYGKGTIQKLDIVVLDRWCHYLNCTLEDIIEYQK